MRKVEGVDVLPLKLSKTDFRFWIVFDNSKSRIFFYFLREWEREEGEEEEEGEEGVEGVEGEEGVEFLEFFVAREQDAPTTFTTPNL